MTTKPKRKMRFGISMIGASLALTLVLFACSQSEQHLTETNGVDDISLSGDIYQNVEIMPEYPGGMDSLFAFLGSNINYPKEAKDKGVEGKVLVNFIIDKDGSVIGSKATNGIGYGCDEEAVRVVSSMPDWTPGINNGKPVKVEFNLPINFQLGETEKNVTRIRVIDDSDSVFKVVDQMPVFPGGTQELMQYLGSTIKYPKQAKRDSIQGRVFVSFVVEKNGTVTGTKVLRGIGDGCDEEALRVISTMPAWEPGRDENGKAVRVAYTIPIKYALN